LSRDISSVKQIGTVAFLAAIKQAMMSADVESDQRRYFDRAPNTSDLPPDAALLLRRHNLKRRGRKQISTRPQASLVCFHFWP
jgi:hypothetical protein